ncbi:protein of unknown function (plasmid) [Shinella sp. WSC3-e]|nr:hypothetical protein SHINE37_100223 [Rhizobiaceae bacterium]CAK7261773.1 protein of unknown function [Shinella sp. WSC3-e]
MPSFRTDACGSSVARQGFDGVQLCGVAGGKEAEDDTDKGRAGEGHDDGSGGEDHFEVGAQQIEKSAEPEGEHDPHEAADKANQNGLDQELGEDVAAARADGRTNPGAADSNLTLLVRCRAWSVWRAPSQSINRQRVLAMWMTCRRLSAKH